jgi:hypothetical protein
MKTTLIALTAVAALSACGASQSPSPAAALGSAVEKTNAKPDYNGNIYWNKKSVRVRSSSLKGARAELSFFGPDGYSTYAPYCKNGSALTATPHRQWGNPKKYLHVAYRFTTASAGPDDCSFTVVLDNTGSPPFATLKIHIVSK